MTDDIELLNAEQVGKMLGQSPRTIREWARKHKIPVTLIGTRRLFNKTDITDFVKANSLPARNNDDGVE
jgi:excisionase family DNA binding protein